MMSSTLFPLLALAFASGPTTPATDLGARVAPLAVIGGETAQPCAWPTTVAVTTSGGLCTGTLVHPSLVVYAAHCGTNSARVRLGENSNTPALDIEPVDCQTNPDYLGESSQGQDWAFCVLPEALALPVTPPLYGCELEVLEPGAAVVIAGFGQSGSGMGSGTKRWAITEIVTTFGNTINIGGDGVSTCPGDSGGSALMQLADGGWRALSMVSTGIDCGSGAVHALMHPAVPWIEATSGIDITPCHDADGTWAPGPQCTGFLGGAPGASGGTWADGCADLLPSGDAQTCGAAYDPEAGLDESGGGSTSGPAQEGDSSGGTAAGDDAPASEDDSTGTEEDTTDGGGCRMGSHSSLWCLLVLTFRRARRR
jgi:hypothetical protein